MIHILLVDDQPVLLEITQLFLEKTGDISVDTAGCATEALAKLHQNKYDAIVSDYDMPAMDGIEFLKVIKNTEKEKPFIIFTGKSREEVVIEALNSGADFYLQKGSDPKVQFAELANMIQQAVMRKRVEEALLQSETNYRTLVENTQDSIYMVDRNGRYLFINHHHEARLGIPHDECQKYSYEDLHTPEDTKNFIGKVKGVIETGEPISDQYERDGRWFVRKISPIKNEIVDQAIAATVISTEITETQLLKDAVQSLNAQFKVLLEVISDSIYSVDPTCHYLFMNSHHRRRLKIPDDRYKGKSYSDYHDSEESARFEATINKILQTHEPYREGYDDDGWWYIRTFSPVIDEVSGKVTAIVIVSVDPSGRREEVE
jgi:PAS domain S-box-containing protein